MSRRIRTMLCQGAASALFVAGPTFAGPDEIGSLPHWMLRAQQRLALTPTQQRELRLLVDGNAARLRALQPPRVRHEDLQSLQREFRDALAQILTPEQLAEWNVLLEELLGAVHLRNPPVLAERRH